MKLQPRQELLKLWEAAARVSSPTRRKWEWGGRDGTNSISDAEQLLIFMFPAAEMPEFRIDIPDSTADDVLEALTALGDSVEIPKRMLDAIDDYLTRYTGKDGTPIFSGDSYFLTDDPEETATQEQRELAVVDSFSMAITLMLGTLGFLQVFRSSVRRDETLKKIADVEQRANTRLSAAMVGLLRSFTVHVFDPDSPEGRALLRTANQTGAPDRLVLDELKVQFTPIRAGLRALTIGSGQADLDNENLLFECGWSWGIVQNAPEVETDLMVGKQVTGIAAELPFLYFTVNALVGIVDLWSDRTRVLGLLDDDQQKLANALQVRWTLTQSYWRTISTFGPGRWPLEDIPWRTTDGKESDYYSLGVTAMVVQYLLQTRAGDVDLNRVAGVLEELARSARITRRPIESDSPAVALHWPGVKVTLRGTEKMGPQLVWLVSDFAITLLKRTIWVASITQNTRTRERLHNLADGIWAHLSLRRYSRLPLEGLWDDPANAFTSLTRPNNHRPSWYFSERIVEFLVSAAADSRRPPLRSQQVFDLSGEMLAEAEHLLSRELVLRPTHSNRSDQSSLARIESALARARVIMGERPSSAHSLITDALLELERLAAAREDASEAM